MNAIASLWSTRSPRERRVLAIGAAAAAILLVFALVWLPLERTRHRLAHELPRLRASVSAMERQAEEVKRLRAMPEAPGRAANVSALIASGELARGLPGGQIFLVDEKRVSVVGADVAFGTLLEWLATAQAFHGLRVEAARIEALPTMGRVKAELRLARS